MHVAAIYFIEENVGGLGNTAIDMDECASLAGVTKCAHMAIYCTLRMKRLGVPDGKRDAQLFKTRNMRQAACPCNIHIYTIVCI